MKIVALVPIKLNSQRLPHKNILPIAGHPLCWHICNTLNGIDSIDEVYVYCSDEAVREYVPQETKFLSRPKWLDGDSIKGFDIYREFIKAIDSDIYVLAHTTSPFISRESIERALRNVIDNGYDSAFSAKREQTFSWYKDEPINYDLNDVPRTQDMKPVWIETSGFYIFKKEVFTEHNRRVGFKPFIQEVSGIEAIDIDEKKDFELASVMAANLNTRSGIKRILIAGPCVIESEENVMLIAEKVKGIAERLGLDYYFKASFDKANRTSIRSYRGPGIDEGLGILKKVKETYGLKICTDIHEPWQAEKVAAVADIIQIPAFLCRQTDLLVAAAKTGKVINIKKAQFLAPWDMKNVVKKVEDSGNTDIMLCERGTSFGYNTLVVDMTSIVEMKKLGYPVVFDATHSVQKPGGKGDATGGNREYVEPLAKAAVAAGADALFFEVHPDPDNALSDGPNMVRLDEFEGMLRRILAINDGNRDYTKTEFDAKGTVNTEKVEKENLHLSNIDTCHTVESESNRISDAVIDARQVFDIEINGLLQLRDALNDAFIEILDRIVSCKGKVVITGMGKPGHIGRKICATLSSLGTPTIFLHPAEAMHGDLGIVTRDDVVIAISYSGESDEIIHILPNIKFKEATLVAVTSNPESTLAIAADIVQVLPNAEEACYLGLAPTTSTTMELVYGDALAVAASKIYGFRQEDFGKNHPAGSLGKKIILKTRDLMVKGDNNPVVNRNATMKDAIIMISRCGVGMVSIINENEEVVGVISDGDLRRLLENREDIYSMSVMSVMTKNPIVVDEYTLAYKALSLMINHNINSLPVTSDGRLVGAIKMQSILNAGIIWGGGGTEDVISSHLSS